ncbi:flagellar basal body P-ring formation chaperone FlgA [Limnohabitans sp. DCL3]|uniref:flagellar basal body P-ring formation chaperone FlgA n=1 Tax=Limnohabitans sp. DCL3 TaxID=3374103 RepID=UPI003A8B9BCB
MHTDRQNFHTLMTPFLQGLCVCLDVLMVRAMGWGLLVCLLGTSSFAANPAKPQGTPIAASEVLQTSVQKWVAQTRKVSPEQVSLAPLDNRVKVRACDQALRMDVPFSNAETVRVRCAQPVWQQFVRVSVAGQTPEIPPPAPAEVATQVKVPAPAKRWVLVAKVPLQRGMMLNETHVSREEVDTSNMPVNVLEHASELLHAEAVRDVRPGTPLRSQDIRPMVLVKRGQMVLLSVGQAQGFQISARVEALQDGRFGDQIKLKNRDSGRELSGRVQGPNQVVGL